MIRTPARKMSVAIVRRAIAEDAEVLGIIGPAAYAEAYGYLWDRPDAYSEQLRTFGARAPSKRILRLRANAGFFDMISYRRSASWGGVLVAGGEAWRAGAGRPKGAKTRWPPEIAAELRRLADGLQRLQQHRRDEHEALQPMSERSP